MLFAGCGKERRISFLHLGGDELHPLSLQLQDAFGHRCLRPTLATADLIIIDSCTFQRPTPVAETAPSRRDKLVGGFIHRLGAKICPFGLQSADLFEDPFHIPAAIPVNFFRSQTRCFQCRPPIAEIFRPDRRINHGVVLAQGHRTEGKIEAECGQVPNLFHDHLFRPLPILANRLIGNARRLHCLLPASVVTDRCSQKLLIVQTNVIGIEGFTLFFPLANFGKDPLCTPTKIFA